MPKRFKQRHDEFFQRLLAQPSNAAALLRERLPKEVVALLIDEPPESVPGNFISQRLRGYRTDRLFRTRTLTGQPVFIYCLLEHKSTPDPRIALQLLGYQYQLLDHWNRTEGNNPDGSWRPLPAILTMVVYHGTHEWLVPLSLAEATDSNSALRPYLVDFRYQLVDLGRVPDTNLSHERTLRVGLLILKHGNLGWTTKKQLTRLVIEAQRLGNDDLATLLYYLLADVDELKTRLIRQILTELLPGQEEHFMSTAAAKWKAEGEAKGKAEGEAEGKAEGKAEGEALVLKRQIKRRFGTLPQWAQTQIDKADTTQLEAWAEAIFDAPDIEHLLGQAEP